MPDILPGMSATDAKTEELRAAHDVLAEFAAFWGGRRAEGQEGSPQGFLLAQRNS